MAERNIVVRAIDYARAKKLELAAAATLAPAAFLGGCGGKEGGAQVAFVTQTPTATAEAFTATATAIPTNTPEPTATPKTVVPLIEDGEIKAGLVSVYEGKNLPSGVCPLNMVTGLVDEVYAQYRIDPDKSPQGALATVYAHLIVFSENGNPKAAELAERIRAGVVDVFIPQTLKIRGLPATNAPEVVAAWNRNVERRVAEIKDGPDCDIHLVPQDKKAK